MFLHLRGLKNTIFVRIIGIGSNCAKPANWEDVQPKDRFNPEIYGHNDHFLKNCHSKKISKLITFAQVCNIVREIVDILHKQ